MLRLLSICDRDLKFYHVYNTTIYGKIFTVDRRNFNSEPYRRTQINNPEESQPECAKWTHVFYTTVFHTLIYCFRKWLYFHFRVLCLFCPRVGHFKIKREEDFLKWATRNGPCGVLMAKMVIGWTQTCFQD